MVLYFDFYMKEKQKPKIPEKEKLLGYSTDNL
jgi:hypothetical protein